MGLAPFPLSLSFQFGFFFWRWVTLLRGSSFSPLDHHFFFMKIMHKTHQLLKFFPLPSFFYFLLKYSYFIFLPVLLFQAVPYLPLSMFPAPPPCACSCRPLLALDLLCSPSFLPLLPALLPLSNCASPTPILPAPYSTSKCITFFATLRHISIQHLNHIQLL